MCIAQTISGDLAADYQDGTFPLGWSYQWNSLGDIGDQDHYTDLISGTDASGGFWSPDAVLPGGSWGAGSLQLRKTNHKRYLMAHPGSESGLNHKPGLPKCLILCFTIPEDGTYSLGATEIKAMSKDSDGVGYIIYVNNKKMLSGKVSPDESKIISDSLGRLSPGDKVYLCVGPEATSAHDVVYLAFQISKDR